jgi:hypothetical protein
MSEQRDIQTPIGVDIAHEMTEEEEYAKIASILDRGYLNDRLNVPLPPDVHGEWVRNDPMEISRVSSVGFTIDTKYAPAYGIMGDGTGKSILGDVVFMTCSMRTFEIIEKIRRKRYNDAHVVRQIEDDELADNLKSIGLTPTSSSTLKEVTKDK